MYPYYTENGAARRKALQKEGIYIPTLWSAVFALCEKGAREYKLAENILPLPIDQRYGPEEMEALVSRLTRESGVKPIPILFYKNILVSPSTPTSHWRTWTASATLYWPAESKEF